MNKDRKELKELKEWMKKYSNEHGGAPPSIKEQIMHAKETTHFNSKTFTINDIITIIESMPTRNINIHGVFENYIEVLIDKNEFIKKLKEI